MAEKNLGVAHPFRGQTIDMGCARYRVPKGAYSDTHIFGDNQLNVGLFASLRCRLQAEQREQKTDY